MAYFKTQGALGLTREQQEILINIPEAELQALPPEMKLDLVLRRQEVKASEASAKWDSISTMVAVAIPILAFFGLSSWNKFK